MEILKKIIAPNESIFTGQGTNTYLVGKNDLTLVDPGPKIDSHIESILREGAGRIKRILVTHTHKDHSPAALPISQKLNIPMYGRLVDGLSEWEDETFVPDKILNHGDVVKSAEYKIEIIHTPGHASNHLCFYLEEQKCLLTGDHIMDGSTVVIAPPDGNMRDYLNSLELLEKYKIEIFAPGHGNYMNEPKKTIKSIIRHRLARESKVLRIIKDNRLNFDSLLKMVYSDINEQLLPIARYSLDAHLKKLLDEKRVYIKKNLYFSSS